MYLRYINGELACDITQVQQQNAPMFRGSEYRIFGGIPAPVNLPESRLPIGASACIRRRSFCIFVSGIAFIRYFLALFYVNTKEWVDWPFFP